MHQDGVQPLTANKDVKDAFESLKGRYYSDKAKMVIIRQILLKYDSAATEEDKDKALNELKSYCSWSHNYNKPTNLKKINKRP